MFVAIAGLAATTATVRVRAQPDNGGLALLRKQLIDRLDRIASSVEGLAGYTVVDLTSGERIERLASHAFPTASSIKVAILYELFKQADERRLSLDAAVPWDPSKAVGGSGVLFELSSPLLTLRDYAILMIVLSDNTATNVLIDRVGMEAVNSRMKALGAPGILLRRKMMDLEAAVAGRENAATPGALATLLVAVQKGEGLTAASRDALLAILKKGKSSPMLRGIPAGVAVAGKPGDLDAVRADIGVVYVPDRPYVFVAMTSWLRNDADGERAIEELSRACYEHFSRLATSSEYGRTIR
jgi:beta-lactamase class A